ncbi:unnamed protein product [Sphagnum jensenii]|uniref:CAF1B/HIR1 beta-propeller domain-containing protein n=1 Tax=Sphagnum jensenii TaxID=128206 RepID=A0ABP0VV36_9BRYO
MKGGTVQIAWHGSQPVLSLDFHSPSGLLATAGADHDIKLWSVQQKENAAAAPTVKFEAELSYHSKAVNVLRFAPSGQLLASGGDGGEILIWRQVDNADNQTSWKVFRALVMHQRDVLDLAWSPDSASLMSGSVDNHCIIWKVSTGQAWQVLNEHLHYVQGVAWDPAGQFVVSLSADRTCRIYSSQMIPTSKGTDKGFYVCQQVLAKTDLAPLKQNDKTDLNGSIAGPSKHHLFHDETLPSFFRRLAWSPDASFLVVPSGIHKPFLEAAPCNMSYLISRDDLSRPAIQLPGPSKPVVAVRFCPLVFTLHSTVPEEQQYNTSFSLPYRLVFAVATLDSLLIYDTQHSSPIVVVAGLHYAAITDIAWSADAQYVAVSSQDGYCSLFSFTDAELGVQMPCSEMPPHIASYLPEVLLAKAKTTAAEIIGKAEHVPATSPPKDSSVAVCPRPLKHRRITPSAVIINSPPSDGKIDHIAPREAASDLPASLGEPHCVIPAVTTVDLPSSPSAAALHHSMLNPC